MSEFLFEILTEDMPPSHQDVARKHLYQKFRELLTSLNVNYRELKVLSTPRRLAVIIKDLDREIPGKEEVEIGPPKNVAFDESGKPTPAATGFAQRLGIKVEDLEIIETEKGVYVGYRKKGVPTPVAEILQEKIPEIVYSIPFPKTMHWNGWRFSRRVKNILAKFDDQVLDVELFGRKATAITQGHMMFSPVWFEAENTDSYIRSLKETFVIVENVEREMIIKDALSMMGVEKKPDERLILYWRDSTEYPNLFIGEFPSKYLDLPAEIIKASLIETQKLYPIPGEEGLSNKFVGVADNPTQDLQKIIEGNERVVKARLEDALYFWQEDRKTPMEKRREALRDMLYHEKAGDYLEKSERLAELVSFMAESLGKEKEDLAKSARLCKADLLTQLVGEFPSLQGIAGGLLLREEGYPEHVWKAVYEHYRPVGQEDKLPETEEGCLLSIADKIDDLCVAFASGYRPTGGGDPLGTRRAALGILRILFEKELDLNLAQLLKAGLQNLEGKLETGEDILREIEAFVKTRFKNMLQLMDYRPDVVDAVLEKDGIDVMRVKRKLEALSKATETPGFSAIVKAYKRVANILKGVEERYEIKEDLLKEPAEKTLAEVVKTTKKEIKDLLEEGKYLQALESLLLISPLVDDLFDNVLIMAEEEDLKENRLALLQEVSEIFNFMVDFSKIEV